MKLQASHNNDNQIRRAKAALAELLEAALRRGFYGKTGIVLSVQDGQIQNIRLTVDRVMK
jgi:acetolactate synthase regulatory subunit